MGLDVGDRRIGIALSDPTGTIASPMTTIHREAEARDHEAIAALVRDEGVDLVVIGLPRTLQGDLGYQAQRVLRFGDRLGRVIATPIEYWDERHSTVDAERIVRARGGRRGRAPRGALDDVAAAVILQFYLDARRSSGDARRTEME